MKYPVGLNPVPNISAKFNIVFGRKIHHKLHLRFLKDLAKFGMTEKEFQKFTNMGLLSAETIRLKDSLETSLDRINAEFEQKMVACIAVYIQGAKNRGRKYEEAYDKFNAEVERKNVAIAEKQSELNSLGLFAFSKKKELKDIISDMERELSEYKSDNEPKDLQVAFEKMYG